MNYYNSPSAITNLNNVVSSFNNPSQISLKTVQLNQSASSFNVNDNIWLITNNNYLAYLTLPIQFDGTSCRDGPPVNYLSNKNTSCIVNNINNINPDCTNLPSSSSLSINYFINNFKIITVNLIIKMNFS